MLGIEIVRSVAVPFGRANVDTDLIYPGGLSKLSGWRDDPVHAENLFRTLRQDEAGAQRPGFFLNDPLYSEAQILLAGENFGCGSSRETAVWALRDAGFQCIVAPSFGEIFYNNCCLNGIIPAAVSAGAAVELRELAEIAAQRAGGLRLTVNLRELRIQADDGQRWGFTLPRQRQQMLLSGLGEIEFSLTYEAQVAEREDAIAGRYPWLSHVPDGLASA